MASRLAFEIRGPMQLSALRGRLRRGARLPTKSTWAGVDPDDIAIRYELPDRTETTLQEIEGVAVRVYKDQAPDYDGSLLDDLVLLAEEYDAEGGEESAGARVDQLVRLATKLLERYGPLGLCDEHGLPIACEAFCHTILPQCEHVSHLLDAARWCRAASSAANELRSGRTISSATAQVLGLAESPPFLLTARIHPDDLVLLQRRLADPIVNDWRRLEAALEDLRSSVDASVGALPVLAKALITQCARSGPQRVCRNPMCGNTFPPEPPQRRYCGTDECDRSRGRQRQEKLYQCVCGHRLSATRTECLYCGAAVS